MCPRSCCSHEAGGSTTGTVSRNRVGESVTVNVLSSDETEAVVGSVTLGANETSGVFTITAVDDTLVDGDQTVTMASSSADARGGAGRREVARVVRAGPCARTRA